MSQENVEIVRRGWDAWISDDIDALVEVFSPAVEWDTTSFEGWPEAGVYWGHEGVRRFLEDWLSSWERFDSGVEEYVDVGDDRVLVLCWQHGFGPGSHAPVEMKWAQICTLRQGLVTRSEGPQDLVACLSRARRAHKERRRHFSDRSWSLVAPVSRGFTEFHSSIWDDAGVSWP